MGQRAISGKGPVEMKVGVDSGSACYQWEGTSRNEDQSRQWVSVLSVGRDQWK